MPVIGTAGHVDHGKSTLVQALTGRDPDRWEEEKRRGLTIDLGFAWTTLPGGVEVGFVDVPGHEKFLKNMLAGIESIDVGLLVVAADEGWMPQTEEHLAVLDAVGIQHIVVVVSRIDLVDEETAELARLEIEDQAAGTVAEGAPVVMASAVSGEGLDELRAELASEVEAAGVIDIGRPRLWIDRVFPVSGAGTVVTGTLTGGSISVDDRLWLWPLDREVRVRGLHSHDTPRSVVVPGTRTAVNLAGIDHREVSRGAMLGVRSDWSPGRRWLVELQTVRTLEEPLTARGAFSVHLGAGAWPVRLRPLEGAIGERGLALISLSEGVAASSGDRFVVFDAGRRMVVAGGTVLDPAPARRPDTSIADRPLGTPDERAEALLDTRGADRLETIRAHSGGGEVVGAIGAGAMVMSPDWSAKLETEAVTMARAYQAQNPLRSGIPKAQLASQLGVDAPVLEALVGWSERLVEDQAAVATSDFSGSLGAADEEAWGQARRRLQADHFAPTPVRDLGLGSELVHALVRRGDLVELADGLMYLPATLDALVIRVQSLRAPFTVSEFRDELGVTRRHAVPMLEWLDQQRVTRRQGDRRVVIQSGP